MLKWSNFHITINFNVVDEDMVYTIKEAIEYAFGRELIFTWLKKVENRKQRPFQDGEEDQVETIRLRVGLENGGEQNKGVHAHILLEVGHRTMVQIDKRELKEALDFK